MADSLIEVTVYVFYPGERYWVSMLEDIDLWEADWEERVKEIPNEPNPPFETEDKDPQVEFTEKLLGFAFRVIGDGFGEGPPCALANELDCIGNDIFEEWRDYFVDSAKLYINQMTNPPDPFVEFTGKDLVKCFRWLEVSDAWTEESGTYEYREYDTRIEFLGRVRLSDIAKLVEKE